MNRRQRMPAKGQTEFDFDRGDQLALLDALRIPSGKVQDGKSRPPVSGATAKSTLRAIESHARTTGQSWAAAPTIGKEINRSERTVRRAIGYLEGLEILVVERPDGKPSRCRINWGEISLLVRKSDPGHSLANPGQFDTDPGQSDVDPGHSVRRSVTNRKTKRPPSSPTTAVATDRPTEAEPRSDWKEVVEALCGILGDWRRAIRDAKQNGVGPEHVQRVIEHYHKLGSRVGPGALYWRLRNAHPSLEPQDGWAVELEPKRAPSKPSSGVIYSRIVSRGRKLGAPDDVIQATLEKALQAAGYPSDAEVYSSRSGVSPPVAKAITEALL